MNAGLPVTVQIGGRGGGAFLPVAPIYSLCDIFSEIVELWNSTSQILGMAGTHEAGSFVSTTAH